MTQPYAMCGTTSDTQSDSDQLRGFDTPIAAIGAADSAMAPTVVAAPAVVAEGRQPAARMAP